MAACKVSNFDSLDKFLTKTRVSKDQKFTHVSMEGGKYFIDKDRYPNFWELVTNTIEKFYILETRFDETPLTLDFDISHPGDDVHQLYTREHVKEMHLAVVDCLQKIVRDPIDPNDFLCIFLSKDPYTTVLDGRSIVKHGFHLQYPKILFNTKDCDNIILPILGKDTEHIFGADYLDPNSCKVSWFVYGACKPGKKPYLFDDAFDHLANTIKLNHNDAVYPKCFGTSKDSFLAKFLSIFPHDRQSYLKTVDPDLKSQKMQQSITRKLLKAVERVKYDVTNKSQITVEKLYKIEKLTSLLPEAAADSRDVWLSTGFCLWQLTEGSKEGFTIWVDFSSKSNKFNHEECRRMWFNEMKPNGYTMGTLIYMAKTYNPEGYKTFVAVHECGPGMIELDGSNVGMARVMKAHFGDDYVCSNVKDQQWYHFNDNVWVELNCGTSLRQYISDPTGPIYVVLNNREKSLNRLLKQREYDDDIEPCDSVADDQDDPYSRWDMELMGTPKLVLDEMLKTLKKIKKQLGMTSYKNNVMRECAEMFYDPTFMTKLDANPNIIAFRNGVFDFKECTFRQGKLTDYVSKQLPLNFVDYEGRPFIGCTNELYNYPPPLDGKKDHETALQYAKRLAYEQSTSQVALDLLITPASTTPCKQPHKCLASHDPNDFKDRGIQALLHFFSKVFPDEQVRTFFLRQAAMSFVGGNPDKLCLFWTGCGNNGKTVTQTLFERMFGTYAVKMGTQVLTGKKPGAGTANPELARIGNGVRWAVMEEPNNDENINAGTLKSMTGNDTFFARDLYKSGKDTKEITPLFKLHLICNTLPTIKNSDAATWSRVRVIPFEARFIPREKCPKDYDERVRTKTFPVDTKFTDKIPSLVEPLAWYLIYYWSHMKNEIGIYKPPRKVMEATREYERENNIFKQFADACIVEKEGTLLSTRSLYLKFREWVSEMYPSLVQGLANQNKAVKEFTTILGEKTPRGWPNYTLDDQEST